MIYRILLALLALIPFGSCQAQEANVRQIYLIQNSGWMEPYYLDQASQFLKLASGLVEASQLERVGITVATFNQNNQIPGRDSPEVLYSGVYDQTVVDAALKKITLPRRPNGKYADADFLGALQATIGQLLQGQQGIIWMLSNNKNSPNNSQDVAANTRGFYDLLRNSEFVTRMVAFPIRMAVAGPHFSEKGFIIYGIAYGADAGRALDVLTANNTPLRTLFTNPPVFLKPVEPQTLEFELNTQSLDDGAKISMQNGVLVIDGMPASSQSTVNFVGRVRNVAYPKKIVTATVSAQWRSSADVGSISVNPAALNNLAAGATSEPVDFRLTLPPINRPGGLEGLFQSEAVADGEVGITLDQLSFDLDDAFIEQAAAVFGGEMMGEGQRSFVEQQLPSIFFDFRQIDQTVTKIPIRIVYHFSPWPLYVATTALGVLLVLLVAVALLLTRARLHAIDVAGSPQRLTLKPGQSTQVLGGDGRIHVVKGRLFGRPIVSPLR